MRRGPARGRRAQRDTPLPSLAANTSTATLPVSGSEEPFTDLTYGTPRGRGNNNCYAYAIDSYRNAGASKLQPGNLSLRNGAAMNLSSCDAITTRAMADLKNRGYAAPPESACKKGYYKVMAFLAPGNDYHWYRQHKDALVRLTTEVPTVAALARSMGVPSSRIYAPSARPRVGDVVLVKDAKLWSHKQGHATGPLLKDACGKAIRDPRVACKKYTEELNYTQFCGAMCVKNRHRV